MDKDLTDRFNHLHCKPHKRIHSVSEGTCESFKAGLFSKSLHQRFLNYFSSRPKLYRNFWQNISLTFIIRTHQNSFWIWAIILEPLVFLKLTNRHDKSAHRWKLDLWLLTRGPMHVYMKSCLQQLGATDKKFPCTQRTTGYFFCVFFVNILKWYSSGWGHNLIKITSQLPQDLACYMQWYFYSALQIKTHLNSSF